MSILLRGGRVIDPASGRDEVIDLAFADGVVTAVGTSDAFGASDAGASGAEVLDCAGLVITPGFVDLHTHLREPGGEHKETVATGTRAAALGGFTAVAAMANTDPVGDTAAVLEEVRRLGEEAGSCEVFPVGAITRDLAGEELTELGEFARIGIRMISDDGHCVPDARMLRMAMTYARPFDLVLAEHCEDVSLSQGWQMHEGPTSGRLGLEGMPAEAEEVIVARDLLIARLTGGRLHLCHLSAAGSVELVRRAKADGVRVTAEVTPHHLALTDEDLVGYDTSRKVNPPMRSSEDREALIDGLADGTIDAIATDHAPHAPEEKEREFDQTPPGTIGLETALAVVLTSLVAPGKVTLQRAIEALTVAPAKILRADGHGGPIEVGAPANLTVFDPEATWTVQPPFASRSRNSAFIGQELHGRVVHTFFRGTSVVRDGVHREQVVA